MRRQQLASTPSRSDVAVARRSRGNAVRATLHRWPGEYGAPCRRPRCLPIWSDAPNRPHGRHALGVLAQQRVALPALAMPSARCAGLRGVVER